MAEDLMAETDENGETTTYSDDDELARRLAAYIHVEEKERGKIVHIKAAMLFNDVVATCKMAGMDYEDFMQAWADAWDRVETVRAQ